MAARKGKKGRKHGRNKRRASSLKQTERTAANKMRRLNYERKKAGLPPVGPAEAAKKLANHTI